MKTNASQYARSKSTGHIVSAGEGPEWNRFRFVPNVEGPSTLFKVFPVSSAALMLRGLIATQPGLEFELQRIHGHAVISLEATPAFCVEMEGRDTGPGVSFYQDSVRLAHAPQIAPPAGSEMQAAVERGPEIRRLHHPRYRFSAGVLDAS